MKDKLPKIDKQKITNLKTKVQEEYYYHSVNKSAKEEKENTISLRSRKNGDEGALKLEELIERINLEVKNMEL